MTIHEDWRILKQKLAHIQNETNSLIISPKLITMLVIAEDHRFWKHHGVDFISIFRAVWRTIFCKKREGASTIAMQLVRVLTGRYERKMSRKILEIQLAIRLTKHLKKEDIPKLYLFVAYYGWRMNGLIQSSHRLGVDLSTLNEFEAASIVARLKYPEPQKHNQIRHDQILMRTKYILYQAANSTNTK